MNLVPNVLKNVFIRSSNRRNHKRFACVFPADLHFVEDGLTIRGFVTEMSQGGLKFKPNQTFIMRRSNELVRINTSTATLEAVVRNTSPNGYGVEFSHPMEAEELANFLMHFSEVANG